MKKLFYIFGFLLTLSIVFVISFNKNSQAFELNAEKSEFQEVINKFFSASFRESDEELKEITTNMPTDFYEMLLKCDDQKRHLAENLGSDETLEYLKKSDAVSSLFIDGVSQIKIDLTLKRLNMFISDLKRVKYQNYEIIKEQNNEKHAIVLVGFGKEKYKGKRFIEQRYFFMNKENNEWKIFRIGADEIKLENEYFALSSCSDKSILSTAQFDTN